MWLTLAAKLSPVYIFPLSSSSPVPITTSLFLVLPKIKTIQNWVDDQDIFIFAAASVIKISLLFIYVRTTA